jgi:cell division protease FtsH
VTTADFTVAVERIVAGSERKGWLLQPHERRMVAYHGHALAAANLPGTDPVHKSLLLSHPRRTS